MKFTRRWTVLLAICPAVTTAVLADQPHSEPLRRIAFGSCATQARPQPIWDAVVATRPELTILLGDNIYADTLDMNVMRAKYAKIRRDAGLSVAAQDLPDPRDLGRSRPGTQ